MQIFKNKTVLIIFALLLILFFSNDFGLIDIEKTAIFTAIAIDKEENGYKVTAQIAVPEATDTNTENQKTIITGHGSTVGAAIKNVGDVSGWFPKLSFCNLMIIGNDLAQENIIKVLDYFAKSLRIQDSALVVLAEEDGAKILEKASPLDNISSFSLQKILLKDPGFDRDVVSTDIKTFCANYYSYSSSSVMPLVKIIKEPSPSSEESKPQTEQNGGENKGDSLFDATTTALFKDGTLVGTLEKELTLAYNLLYSNPSQTIIQVTDVQGQDLNNYLLTIIDQDKKVSLDFSDNKICFNVSLDMYCKINDTTNNSSDNEGHLESSFIPPSVKEKAEKDIKEAIEKLIHKEKQSKCDFLKIQENLYRYHNDFFYKYKDSFLENFTYNINVVFHGQK